MTDPVALAMRRQRMPAAGLRVAIAQIAMHWSCAENTAAIIGALSVAAAQRARLCVFAELAITGFHRQIKAQAVPALVDDGLSTVRRTCRELAIAAVVGLPTYAGGAIPYNSHVHVDERGGIAAVVNKAGLTPSEATFFAAGTTRPRAMLSGHACTSVLCREVEDHALLGEQIAPGAADIVFWPGFIGQSPVEPVEIDYLVHAQRVAVDCKAHVIQCNWPNSLNKPEVDYLGESVAIAPTGDVLFHLPRAASGIAVFELGAQDYRWIPEIT